LFESVVWPVAVREVNESNAPISPAGMVDIAARIPSGHGVRAETLEERRPCLHRNQRSALSASALARKVYIPGLQSEGWEVAALCSRNREKATKVRRGAGVPNVHTDPLELISARRHRCGRDCNAARSPP
jgi:hypothetical protein